MINLHNRGTMFFLKAYVAIALIAATVLSPLTLSFIPILLLIWHLYLWRWPINAIISLLTDYFLFFAIALLLTPHLGPFLPLLPALPVLLLVNNRLEEATEIVTTQETSYVRRPTNTCITLLLIAVVVLCISLLMSSLSLVLVSSTVIIYFAILGTVILRRLPLKPVAETQIQHRMVAGTEAHLDITLINKTGVGGLLFLESPYEWLEVNPNVLSLKQNQLVIKLSLSPPLAGPSVIKVKGKAIDRWGLVQISFELDTVNLYVIPRARYAAWLARKYLAETKAGALPIIINIEATKPIYGLRRGVEYYGSQLYQPGDSLKNIDWKHSSKYNELISKEFAEFQGQSAVILINLSVSNAEEADKLAYSIIVTAISLAQENIPAALAVYNHEGVTLTTTTLQPRQLLTRSLQIAQEMVTFINPVKYLNPPDITKLRGNISRLRSTDSKAVEVLSQLLQLEYKNLDKAARLNPATKALSEVFTKVDNQSNIVIISHRNHDAEALAFNTFNFTRKGNAVITV